jgi:hypothetical protein
LISRLGKFEPAKLTFMDGIFAAIVEKPVLEVSKGRGGLSIGL